MHQTDEIQIDETKFVFQLHDAQSINHITIFNLPNSSSHLAFASLTISDTFRSVSRWVRSDCPFFVARKAVPALGRAL